MSYEAARVRHDQAGNEVVDFPQPFDDLKDALNYIANTPISKDGNRPWIRCTEITDHRQAFVVNGGKYSPQLTKTAIMGAFLAQGWTVDRIIDNLAMKTYSPHHASVRVAHDQETKTFWISGEYVSEGRNVMSTCFAQLNEWSTLNEIIASVAGFIQEAEAFVNDSFAVRHLGTP